MLECGAEVFRERESDDEYAFKRARGRSSFYTEFSRRLRRNPRRRARWYRVCRGRVAAEEAIWRKFANGQMAGPAAQSATQGGRNKPHGQLYWSCPFVQEHLRQRVSRIAGWLAPSQTNMMGGARRSAAAFALKGYGDSCNAIYISPIIYRATCARRSGTRAGGGCEAGGRCRAAGCGDAG
jgi:hypothetical protein